MRSKENLLKRIACSLCYFNSNYKIQYFIKLYGVQIGGREPSFRSKRRGRSGTYDFCLAYVGWRKEQVVYHCKCFCIFFNIC
jgi:hypothetical protein